MRDAPLLSVVVASVSSLELLAECLARLRPQCASVGAELIVARAASEPSPELTHLAGGCRFRGVPAGAGLARVRGAGLNGAAGEWVALTEDSCLADERWIEALMTAITPDVHVLGGSMGNAQRVRVTDCAAFFAEYGVYGGSMDRGQTPLFAAANVMYHRSVVSRVARWCDDGEWENVIHDRLRASGHRFRLVPEARVQLNASHAVGAFCKNRFQHGRAYAEARARTLPGWRRMALAAGTLLLPPLFAARIARSVQPEEREDFPRALPMTLTYLSAWALGEAVGYVGGGATG